MIHATRYLGLVQKLLIERGCITDLVATRNPVVMCVICATLITSESWAARAFVHVMIHNNSTCAHIKCGLVSVRLFGSHVTASVHFRPLPLNVIHNTFHTRPT